MDHSKTIQKFNKFDILAEAAFSHYANGGFTEGSPLKIKKSFLNSDYFKQHYSGSKDFVNWLKSEIDRDATFWIHRVVKDGPGQDIKDANDNFGAGNVYLEIKPDPRVVRWPTELNKFVLPANFDYVEVWTDAINLPPLDAIRKDYEYEKIKEYENDTKLGNHPEDDELPKNNTSLPNAKKWADKKPGAGNTPKKY